MMESIEIWDSMHTMGLELSHEIQSSMDSPVLFDAFWLATPMELFFWWKRCWFPNTGPAVKTMVGSPGIEPGGRRTTG